MNLVLQRWRVSVLALFLLTMLYGCVVAGGGYDGDVGVG